MGYRVGHRRLRVGHSGGKQCCICGHRRSWKVIGVFWTDVSRFRRFDFPPPHFQKVLMGANEATVGLIRSTCLSLTETNIRCWVCLIMSFPSSLPGPVLMDEFVEWYRRQHSPTSSGFWTRQQHESIKSSCGTPLMTVGLLFVSWGTKDLDCATTAGDYATRKMPHYLEWLLDGISCRLVSFLVEKDIWLLIRIETKRTQPAQVNFMQSRRGRTQDTSAK